eukprot:gene6396-8640_t
MGRTKDETVAPGGEKTRIFAVIAAHRSDIRVADAFTMPPTHMSAPKSRLHYAWVVAGVTFVTLLAAAGSRAARAEARDGVRVVSGRMPSIVSVLDVGSSKVACIIARLTPRPADSCLPGRTHDLQVLGYGMQRARGMKSGVVIDLDQAEQSIRLAVDAAERLRIVVEPGGAVAL